MHGCTCTAAHARLHMHLSCAYLRSARMSPVYLRCISGRRTLAMSRSFWPGTTRDCFVCPPGPTHVIVFLVFSLPGCVELEATHRAAAGHERRCAFSLPGISASGPAPHGTHGVGTRSRYAHVNTAPRSALRSSVPRESRRSQRLRRGRRTCPLRHG